MLFFFYFLHLNPCLTRGEARSSMPQLFFWLSGALADRQTKQTMMLCVSVWDVRQSEMQFVLSENDFLGLV